jgi:hypothetical protein
MSDSFDYGLRVLLNFRSKLCSNHSAIKNISIRAIILLEKFTIKKSLTKDTV